VKGVHSLGCVGFLEESWWIETIVEVWNLGLGLFCVESGYPRRTYLLMDSYLQLRGGLLLRENEQQFLWMGGSSFIRIHLVSLLIDKCYYFFITLQGEHILVEVFYEPPPKKKIIFCIFIVENFSGGRWVEFFTEVLTSMCLS
jgi:hypothetical protein